MASSSSLFWFENTVSELTDTIKGLLHPTFRIFYDHGILYPKPSQCPHRPPPGYTTFFLEQLQNNLRFPISSFLIDIGTYLQVPIS